MWKRADLHHHTYKDKERDKDLKDIPLILDEFSKNNINLIAITDHDSISFDAIAEYRRVSEEDNFDIKILAGVELGFLYPTDKDPKHLGQIIMIFDDAQEKVLSSDEWKNILKDAGYDKNKCEFLKTFKSIVNQLHQKQINFICIPHFNKGSKQNIKWETSNKLIQEIYNEIIISFDFLEGKYTKNKDIQYVDNARKIVYEKTAVKQGIIMGTDAKDIESCFKNIVNLPWLYGVKDFETLKYISEFPLTRIKYGEEPNIIDNYIQKIEIKNTNGVEYEIELKPGLNSIIGRRGSGKTTLIRSLFNKIKKETEKNDLEINPVSTKTTISQDKVLYFAQNELSEYIAEILKEQFDFKVANNIGFDDLKLDFDGFKTALNNCKNIRINIPELFYSAFDSNIKTIQNKKRNSKAFHQAEFTERFKSVLKNDNAMDIRFIKIDEQKLELFKKEEKISDWLKYQLNIIHKKLNKIKEDEKYKTFKVKNIKDNLDKLIQKNKETKLGKVTENKLHKPKEIIIKINELITARNSVFKIMKNVKSVYIEIKNKNQSDIQNSKKMNELRIQNVIQFSEDISQTQFIHNFLEKKYKILKPKDNYTFEDLLDFKERKNQNKTPDDIFEIETHFYLGKKRIDNLSLGQRHEEFIKNKLEENYDIILLDQPDDDLDAITVQEEILQKFIDWGFTKQIITVTHDPKIVINADSQEIIECSYGILPDNQQYYKNINKTDLQDTSFKILDAKKEYLRIRYKKYGGYDVNR